MNAEAAIIIFLSSLGLYAMVVAISKLVDAIVGQDDVLGGDR